MKEEGLGSCRVFQVTQSNHLVRFKLTPAVVDGDTQLAYELGTLWAIGGGLLAFFIRALLTLCSNNSIDLLEKLVHKDLPFNVESIWIGFKVIFRD